MPSAKSISKVSKQIKQKKGPLHPKGRKAKMLARASLREQKINLTKLHHAEYKDMELLIVRFFQDAITAGEYADLKSFKISDMKIFIEAFIDRDNEELEEMRNERRPGRPSTKKQDLLENRIKKEKHQYLTGWSVPNLTDVDTVELLRKWKGDQGGVTVIKHIICSKNSKDDENEMED